MTYNLKAEMQGKCRRLFYDKATGDVIGVASGGGALEELTGDDLIIATFNDATAPQRIGCIEEYYNPTPAPGMTLKPKSVDLAKVQACHDAVAAHRSAKKDEADFVFEEGIKHFGTEIKSTEALRHALKIKEKLTKDKPEKNKEHDEVISAQTELENKGQAKQAAAEQLLSTREAAVTFNSEQ